MKLFNSNYFRSRILTDNPIFSLITWLSGIVCLGMGILSLIVDLEWYITLMLFASSLLTVGFFYLGKKIENQNKLEIVFLIYFNFIFLPLLYISMDLEVSEMPIYFILGILCTAVLLGGKRRIAMLIIELVIYFLAIWYVIFSNESGAYDTSRLPAYIYIRLLLAILITGIAGGILLKYRNSILLEEVQNSEEQASIAKAANDERDLFMTNLVHEIRIPLKNIIDTTDMLQEMNLEVQREEDIFFIDNIAREMLITTDKLVNDEEEIKSERSVAPPKVVHEIKKFICPDATIMVVDDNIINLEIVKSMLEQYQCKIVGAMSGKECLDMLVHNKVDLILLDYMMPDMDGMETLKNIREAEADTEYQTSVVALTAYVESGAKEMFVTAGFNDYMMKPVELKKIYEILRKYLAEEKIIEV